MQDRQIRDARQTNRGRLRTRRVHTRACIHMRTYAGVYTHASIFQMAINASRAHSSAGFMRPIQGLAMDPPPSPRKSPDDSGGRGSGLRHEHTLVTDLPPAAFACQWFCRPFVTSALNTNLRVSDNPRSLVGAWHHSLSKSPIRAAVRQAAPAIFLTCGSSFFWWRLWWPGG